MRGLLRCSLPIFPFAILGWGATGTQSRYTPPMRFETNLGQAGPDVRYLGRSHGYTLELGEKQIRLFSQHGHETLTVKFQGAARARMELEDRQPGKVNYITAGLKVTGVETG